MKESHIHIIGGTTLIILIIVLHHTTNTPPKIAIHPPKRENPMEERTILARPEDNNEDYVAVASFSTSLDVNDPANNIILTSTPLQDNQTKH